MLKHSVTLEGLISHVDAVRAHHARRPLQLRSGQCGRYCGIVGSLPSRATGVEPAYGFIPDTNPEMVLAVRAEDLVTVPTGD